MTDEVDRIAREVFGFHEIVERLALRDPAVVVRGFDRPNIRLAVERHHDARRKAAALLERVAAAQKPGIVYVATRRAAEQTAAARAEVGVAVTAYHAGLAIGARDAVQERFMADELEVVVATTAFGMGGDKPGVRFVIHEAASESLDAYYQRLVAPAATASRRAGAGAAAVPRRGPRHAQVHPRCRSAGGRRPRPRRARRR